MSLAAPFPYFGGKRRAAPLVWQALGDPGGYVEPFAGSAAVLLARPAVKGRRVETINDADGWLVNMWRAVRHDPAGVAKHAAGPVTEIDYHARLAWLQGRRGPELVSWLEGDPEAHDARAAGWWLYVAACGIGDPWGGGPWVVSDGHLVDSRIHPSELACDQCGKTTYYCGCSAGQGINRKLPHLGDAGRGIHRALPHLGDAGQGINRALPHLGNAGDPPPPPPVNVSSYEPGGHEDQIAAYLDTLTRRLERVRITCGSWGRVAKPSALRAKSGGDGSIGVFLDPPYATSGDLYAGTTDAGVAHEVRLWCLKAPADLRVVLCGYDNEHDQLLAHGWRVIEGKSGGGSGYSTRRDNGRRERLWLSPGCLDQGQDTLFEGAS